MSISWTNWQEPSRESWRTLEGGKQEDSHIIKHGLTDHQDLKAVRIDLWGGGVLNSKTKYSTLYPVQAKKEKQDSKIISMDVDTLCVGGDGQQEEDPVSGVQGLFEDDRMEEDNPSLATTDIKNANPK